MLRCLRSDFITKNNGFHVIRTDDTLTCPFVVKYDSGDENFFKEKCCVEHYVLWWKLKLTFLREYIEQGRKSEMTMSEASNVFVFFKDHDMDLFRSTPLLEIIYIEWYIRLLFLRLLDDGESKTGMRGLMRYRKGKVTVT
jgi:hypothetical protein